MEIGELVAVVIPGQKAEDDCPFSHDKPNPKEENELGGVGTKLGENLTGETGVHKSKPPFGGDFTKCPKDPDPRRASPKLLGVTIRVKGQTILGPKGNALVYPLTCAAHHLIPAQEALKANPILKFMCKDGQPQDFMKGGKAARAAVKGGTRIWGNVAYNVNGGQNGVWLPGNYAVGAAKGGVGVWKSNGKHVSLSGEALANWEKALDMSDAEWRNNYKDPEEVEGPQGGTASSKAQIFMLAGKNYHIDDANFKWAYVKAAMDSAGGQFHDRHKPYSDQVAKYLKKIAEAYATMYDRSTNSKKPCTKCEEARRPAGAKKSLVGPPYAIVGRLVAASNFFKRFVKTQTLTGPEIFTSRWVQEWMKTKSKKAKKGK